MLGARRVARLSARRLLSSTPGVVDSGSGRYVAPTPVYRRLLPKKNVARSKRRTPAQDSSGRVSAHVMANAHEQLEIASALRARFGAGAVQVFDGAGGHVSDDIGAIEGLIHLSAPASGTDAPHGSPPASAFFFTGSTDGDELSRSTCVGVFWSAEPSFEDALLRDLQALGGTGRLTKQEQRERLVVPRTVMKWQPGERSELTRDEILVDAAAGADAALLDTLSFSAALQRHMKLALLEDEMERILASVKRFVRQGRPSLVARALPASLGGVDSGARTMQRLLLMREFNFDDTVMSTPDWLWEQPAREAMYDDMVAEYEIPDRIDAINQQLDYAQVRAAVGAGVGAGTRVVAWTCARARARGACARARA